MAEPAEFKPRFSEEEITKLVSQYQLYPEAFDDREEDLEVLEKHAYYYRKPFAKSEKHQDGFIEKSLKQFGKGWIEGYTTLPPEWVGEKTGTDFGEAPDDTASAIARNLGHLAGFVGYFPGARIAKAFGALKLAGAMRGIRGKSIPMGIATKAQKKVADSVKPILKDLPQFMQNNELLKDMASGAFHLGVASGVSSWTHGVNEMFHSAGFGAVAGGAFRGIGNLKGFGKRLEPHQIKSNGSPDLKKLEPGQMADLTARTMAGAAFQGLPSTLQGATTEEQVYAYAMGAFFGFKETPYQTRMSREYIHDSIKKDHGPDPELNPKWDTLTPEMKEIVKNDFTHFFGPEESMHIAYDILKGRGVSLEDIEKLSKEYREGMEIDETTGEVSFAVDKDEVRAYREAYKDDPRFEDPHDLDMHIARIADLPGKIAGRGGFVEQNLKESWKDSEFPDVERIKIGDEIYSEWTKHHRGGKPTLGAEEKIVDFIEKNYKVTLNEEQSGWWRRWAENTRKKQWIDQIEMVDGEIGILKGKTNAVGNKKDLSQERAIIEDIYALKYAEYFGEAPQKEEGFFRILDHMIWRGKEYDLTRAEAGLTRQNRVAMRKSQKFAEMSDKDLKKAAESKARRQISEAMDKLHNEMWKQGYYHIGGKGDNKKMYFVRKHPTLHHNPKKTNKFFKEIQKSFKKAGVKDFKKIYKSGLERFKQKHPKIKNPSARYKQIYVHNALYDITNNGFKLDKTNEMKDLSAGMEKVLSDGMINSAKAYNKRAQIWFNTGLSANSAFVSGYLRKQGIKNRGNFRVGFFKDADGWYDQNKINLKSGAHEYTEVTDGAIYAREAVVDALNLDKGLPTSGKVNKSFIVSPDTQQGAVLGKYMIHTATPELEAYMDKAGLHMLIPESAAKQTGTREIGQLGFTKKGNLNFDGKKYNLPIFSFRTIMSEITSDKYIKNQRLPKQMFSTLSAYGFKDVDPNTIKEMYEELSNRAFNGTEKGREYVKKFTENMSDENITNLVDNIEDIPVQKLLEMMRNPKYEKFSTKAYEKILRLNREHIESLAEEGELSRDELSRESEINAEFETIIERLSKLYPEGSMGAYLHKFSRDYRMTAMRNFVVTQLTRPKLENSATSRMRPWEIGLRHPNKETSRLRNEDDIFFLDDGFKSLRINDSIIIKGRNTLGEIWEDYQAGKYKGNQDAIEQVLHGTVMRVPMDSISGANSLRFQGFTGVKGFGSLLHPRTMKALGGADLDGDKAFIFFGGEDVGFRQKWREMYHSQRDEYVDKAKNQEKHNKEAIDPDTKTSYRSQLAVDSPDIRNEGSHIVSQYSPYWRGFMSEGASSGRDMLGFAVTNRAAVIGAYNAIRGHDGPKVAMKEIVLESKGRDVLDKDGKPRTASIVLGKDSYSVPFVMKGRTYRIVFKAKTGEKDLQRFREMSRATIALGSDPMDEAGLKGVDVFSSKVLDTLFSYEVRDMRGKTSVVNPRLTKMVNDGKMDFLKGKGLHRLFFKTNSVLYGKNYIEGRAHSYPEIRSGLDAMTFLSESSRNTLMSMLSESMKDVNWSDNIFRHVDHKRLEVLYSQNRDFAEQNEWLKEVLGRTSISTPWGKFIDRIFTNRLHTREGLEKIAKDEDAFIKFRDESFINKKGEKIYVMGEVPYDLKPTNTGNYDYRRNYLDRMVLKAEEFLVNDISDMASLKTLTDLIKKNGYSKELITETHKVSEVIKDMTVQMARRRRDKDDLIKDSSFDEQESNKKFEELQRDNFGIDDKGTAKLDQVRIDTKIREWKKGRPQSEKDLFDVLFLSTFQRGHLDTIAKLKKKGHLSRGEAILLETLEKQANNTSLMRAAMNSKAVADKNLKKFFDDYDSLLSKTKTDLSDAEIELVMKEYTGKKKVTSFRDENGNLIKGEMIETSDLSEADRTYLENIAPFEGIHRGKVTDPELKEVYFSIKDHLEHYHNLDARNLNGLFRGIVGKNMNQATKYDLKLLDNYLKEMRSGTWFRKAMDWMVGKDKNPDIMRSYYWMFPEAIDRNLMREPGMVEWVKDVGPYKDRLGNTIMGEIRRPTSVLGELQQWAVRGQEYSMQKHEQEKDKMKENLRPFVSAVEDGDALFDIAVAMRERRMIPRVLRKKYKDNHHRLTFYEMEYENNWKEVEGKYNELKNKMYRVPMEEETRLMSGDEIVRAINDQITKQNTDVHKWLVGDTEFVESWLAKGRDKNGKESFKSLQNLRKEFMKYLIDTGRKHEQIPIEKFGIDGLRQITKRVLLSLTPGKLMTRNEWAKVSKKLEVTPFDVTGEFPFDVYFPHVSFDRKVADSRLKKVIEHIFSDPNITKEEKQAEIRKLMYQYKQLTGDFMAKDDMTENFDAIQDALKEQALGRKEKAKNILMSDLKRVGNQFSRNAHIGGWSREPEAYDQYMKNIIDTFNKQVAQLASRVSMHSFNEKFYKKTKDAELTHRWTNFFKLYTQSMMGYPAHIPESVMNDPLMKIKGTPYKWLADSQAKKRIDYIGKRLGVGRKELEKWNLDETTLDELSGVEYSQLQAWGALEAKWQLASLLAHPKSSIANLYGGTVHTWISAGTKNLKNARNFEYLQTHINPKWKSMKDVEQWINELGIIEEFLIYEAGLNPKIKSKRYDDFVKDVVKKIKRDPELSDTSLNQLRKKYGVTDTAWNFAASFMRLPERMLRRDAFMSHYLMAKERFGGAIKDFDNPFLIQMAKKGVKGTQFLYSAPFRPIWTNSTLGRVFSRFQLWSWNSVRFRNDTIREAHIHGFQEGTPEFERFKRMAQADAFMLAMSSLFMYSLFENALPAPWNWFQDTADLLMGDDKEKERAFYGSPLGPVQAVVPPAFRLLPPLFKGMMTDDYSKLTDYYLWTIPPFGRLIRDVVGPGGAVENPYYAIAKFTGMPVMQIADLVKKDRDERLGGKFIYG